MTDSCIGYQQRVLIIDDDQLISLALMRALQDGRLNIFAVADGSSALSEIRSNLYDLIFLEVSISDGRGVMLLREISRMSPSTCVVVMSACIPDDEAKDMILENDHFFMPKPFEMLQVRTISRRILAEAGRSRQISAPTANEKRHKRKSTRKPLTGQVRIQPNPGKTYPGMPQQLMGQLIDMNMDGIGISTDLPLPPGQTFNFKSDSGYNEGVVRWSMVSENRFRAGVQFAEKRE